MCSGCFGFFPLITRQSFTSVCWQRATKRSIQTKRRKARLASGLTGKENLKDLKFTVGERGIFKESEWIKKHGHFQSQFILRLTLVCCLKNSSSSERSGAVVGVVRGWGGSGLGRGRKGSHIRGLVAGTPSGTSEQSEAHLASGKASLGFDSSKTFPEAGPERTGPWAVLDSA